MIRGIVRWSVKNPVAANLLMAMIVISGVISYLAMPREVFPNFSLGKIEIFTVWRGAAPGDVEDLITEPIEEVLGQIDGVDDILSTSSEGFSRVHLVLAGGAQVSEVLAQVRDALGRGDLFLPTDAEAPRVFEEKNVFPVLAVFVHGSASQVVLTREADRIQQELAAISGVAQVVVTGSREEQLWVEVDPAALERTGLTLAQIGAVVAGRAREAPVGALETAEGDWLLRVRADVTQPQDLLDLPLGPDPRGAMLRLRDVAQVSNAFERELSRARFNGEPCLHMQVNKDAEADLIDLSIVVHEWLDGDRSNLPPGVQLGTNSDLSIYVRDRLAVMTESGLMGGVLVLACLLAFLDRRVALWTAVGIPVAFLGGIAIAHAAGISLNMVTMFALIVVLGMVVDDAIVVGENAFRLMEEGLPPEEAAIQGVTQVGAPVVATVLTSMAAFLPVLMLTGQAGLFMQPLPLIVSACLAISLVEALAILPAHLAKGRTRKVRAAAALAPGKAPKHWYEPLRAGYVRLLKFSLAWRWSVLGAGLGLLAFVAALAQHRLPFVFFDDFESKIFYVSVRLVPDASLDDSEAVARKMEDICLTMPESDLESINTLIGVSAQNAVDYELGQNLAQVWVELREGDQRTMDATAVVQWLRNNLSDVSPLVETMQIDQPQSGVNGRAIELVLRGQDEAQVAAAAKAIQADLYGFAGVHEIRSSVRSGKRELRIKPTEAGRLMGVSEGLLVAELGTALEGLRWARLRRGGNDLDVVVKLPETVRGDPGALGRLMITTGTGARVRLKDVATWEEGSGPASLHRRDRQRSITLTADVDRSHGNARDIVNSLLERYSDLPQTHGGTTLKPLGDFDDTESSLAGLAKASLVALALIFAILGTLFRSYLQPLVIMSIVPFALVGVVVGHLIMGRDMTLLSLIGLLALCGVVVNDSLILIEFVNQRRAQGVEYMASLIEAGTLRFRPILLTSVTTMAGLTPLTFFSSGQARFLQPMAISVFFGLAAATILVLVLVPCVQACLDDLTLGAKRRWARAPMPGPRSIPS
ncbi:MAG: efflux RND transporter permease subunit [Planctomycetota bacterium]|nr:efflux RND transporter permease subunit [Planctomycetota bacterium]